MKFKLLKKDHKLKYHPYSSTSVANSYICTKCSFKITFTNVEVFNEHNPKHISIKCNNDEQFVFENFVSINDKLIICNYIIENNIFCNYIYSADDVPTCEYILNQKMIADIVC
jgi:hypothetical protein